MNTILFYWSIFTIIGSWGIRLVMLSVVIRRKQSTAAMGWLIVIFFMPWVGLILYLLVGENSLPRRRIERYAQIQDRFRAMLRKYKNHPSAIRPDLSPTLDLAVTLAEHLTHMPILTGNDADLMTRTEDVIDRLVEDIDNAHETVHLMFYIIADDATGNHIGDALIRATNRGVICRVLADAVGSRPMMKTLGKRLTERGIQFHASLTVSLFRFYMARMDLRNHRKIAIIDGRIAYTGSQNIVDAGYGHRDLAWHDIMVRLTGPVVLELQAVFVGDWYFETGSFIEGPGLFVNPTSPGNIMVQTLPSGPTYPTESYQRIVVAAIYAAEHEVTITTPYFVPDEAFIQALQVAALRGVEVELIVPERVDQKVVGAASRAYYDELLQAGISIYLYQDGLLHSKSMRIDNLMAFVGTSNFDIRSFALNFEINLVFYGPSFAGRLKSLQEQYRARSLHLDHATWSARPPVRKLAQNVAKLLSPLL